MTAAAEKPARPPDETFDELYEHAPCGYLTLDAAGHVVRANATILHWLGETAGALVGRRIQTIFSPAGRILYETHVAPLMIGEGVVHQVAIDLRRGDDRRIPVQTEWRRIASTGRRWDAA